MSPKRKIKHKKKNNTESDTNDSNYKESSTESDKESGAGSDSEDKLNKRVLHSTLSKSSPSQSKSFNPKLHSISEDKINNSNEESREKIIPETPHNTNIDKYPNGSHPSQSSSVPETPATESNNKEIREKRNFEEVKNATIDWAGDFPTVWNLNDEKKNTKNHHE